jgi:hypothetical protein
MKVHVVLLLVGGLPEDPEVFTDVGAARSRYNALLDEYGLNPEDPHDDDHDVYFWEGLIAGAGDA